MGEIPSPITPDPDLERRIIALEQAHASTTKVLGRAVVTTAAASQAILAEIERHGGAGMSPFTDQLRAQLEKLRLALEEASRAE